MSIEPENSHSAAVFIRKKRQQKCKRALIQGFIDSCFASTCAGDESIHFTLNRNEYNGIFYHQNPPRYDKEVWCNGEMTNKDLVDAVSRIRQKGYSGRLLLSKEYASIEVDLTTESNTHT